MNNNDIKDLIKLLEDTDDEIYEIVHQKIKDVGIDAIKELHISKSDPINDLHKHRINKLLNVLKVKKLRGDINYWGKNNNHDLLAGLLIIAQYGYPDINIAMVNDELQKIEQTIKAALDKNAGTDVIKVFNDVILNQYKFIGNNHSDDGADSCYINKVLETKTGYPILLCIIYLLMAKKFNVPLIGINSPRHFILAYIGNNTNIDEAMPDNLMQNVTYFIDPFHYGKTYHSDDFNYMLGQMEFDMAFLSSLPASNIDIIKRVMNNVIYSIHQKGKENTAKVLLKIADEL